MLPHKNLVDRLTKKYHQEKWPSSVVSSHLEARNSSSFPRQCLSCEELCCDKRSGLYYSICWIFQSDIKKIEPVLDYYSCDGTQNIPMLFVNDSIPDCHNGADEEDFFKERRHMDYTINTRSDISLLPCFPGDKICFPIFKLCLYEVNYYNGFRYLKTCRNGRHLANSVFFPCYDIPEIIP